jgi:opacity protein-like surface antigen
MQKRLLLVLVLILPLLATAQRNKRYRWEAGIDIGAANFLGDLGGANQIGTHFVKDLELSLTRTAFGAHIRYRSNRYIGYRANFMYGKINGNDALTMERYRHNRNLNFKSNVFELSTVLEFYLSKERPGHVYNYKKLKGWRHIDIQSYGFIGVGVFYYNPKSIAAGQWYALRPLRTEGQGIKPQTKQYSNFSVSFPMGMGLKYAVNRRWNVGLEYGLRLTITDYIDDVSTVYVDPALLTANMDPQTAALAIHFAQPGGFDISAADNGGVDPTGVGQQRGDSKHNDAYMFMCVTVNYKIGKFRKTHSKF